MSSQRYTYVEPRSSDPEVVIQATVASHYVMKVMAALNYKKIPYKMQFLDARKLKQLLPPPHTVPVLLWNGQRIPDSTAICKFLDQQCPTPEGNLFEPVVVSHMFQSVEEAEKWLGGEYYEWNLYWSFIDPEGWQRGLAPFVRKEIPLPGCLQACFGYAVIMVAPVVYPCWAGEAASVHSLESHADMGRVHCVYVAAAWRRRWCWPTASSTRMNA